MVSGLAVEQWTSSLSSRGYWRGHGSFPKPIHMCFVDLEKAFVPQSVLWGVLQDYGVDGLLSLFVSISRHSQGAQGLMFSGLQIPSLQITGMKYLHSLIGPIEQ